MKGSGDISENGRRAGKLSKIVSGSLILSALDGLCTAVYNRLKTGFFARLFCAYNSGRRGEKGASRFVAARRRFVGKTEKSFSFNLVDRILEYLAVCRLKVIGVFLFSFSACACVITLIRGLGINEGRFSNALYSSLIVSALTLVASIPLISSRKTVFSSARESRIMGRVLPSLGFYLDKKSYTGESGRSLVALVFGIAVGMVSLFVDPLIILGALVGSVLVCLILIRPEIGVAGLIFITPILPTMAVAAFLSVVVFSYFLKIVRGKRKLLFETVDRFVLVFAVLLFFGGFVSLSSESVRPALMKTWMMLGFFVIASVRQTREWLGKYVNSVLCSAAIVSLYGIFMYFAGSKLSNVWLDTSMFSDISGRAVSTLENPNMLGEYLVLILPIAASAIISGEFVSRRHLSFFALIMGVCLILTWSRGAWLGLIVAFVFLLFMWHRRSVWLVFGGVLALPLASFVLPTSILNRFMSIGNLADTSTAYRVNIWRGAVRMIRDHLFFGIGIGEGPWNVVYPDYTLPGIEAAPHSHNLFMQITVEMGIIALLVFLAILFFSLQSGFSFFSDLSYSSDVDPSQLLRSGSRSGSSDPKTSLRLSAAGPLCGIIGVLVQGLTDYSWYNYRVFLMFWLILGLGVSFAKNGREYIRDENVPEEENVREHADVDISL